MANANITKYSSIKLDYLFCKNGRYKDDIGIHAFWFAGFIPIQITFLKYKV
jgi:hypothetical protein